MDNTSVARLPPVPTQQALMPTWAGIKCLQMLCQRGPLAGQRAAGPMDSCGGKLKGSETQVWNLQWRGYWRLGTGFASPGGICRTGASWFASRSWWPEVKKDTLLAYHSLLSVFHWVTCCSTLGLYRVIDNIKIQISHFFCRSFIQLKPGTSAQLQIKIKATLILLVLYH